MKRKILIIVLTFITLICTVAFVGCSGGTNGKDGANGKSAYEIWKEQGNSGSKQDFLNSLKGQDGLDGIDGIDGINGQDGKSAYEIWLEVGNTGNQEDFLNWLKGDGTSGTDGKDGADGKSAYEIWLGLGNTGSETDFINWLKGQNGEDGKDGADGKSAYQIWLDAGNKGSEQDFLNWIRGDQPSQEVINGNKGNPLQDQNLNGQYDIFLFGGHVMGSYNINLTIKDMIEMGTGTTVAMSSIVLEPTNIATTYNMYELFPADYRDDINNLTLTTSTNTSKQNALNKLANSFLDCIIIQTGRDHSLGDEVRKQQNLISAVKFAKIATNNNPNVKIMLVAPYAHQANFVETNMAELGIVDYDTHTAFINKEVKDTKTAILNALPNANVEIFSLGDLFASYSTDSQVVKTDLYRIADEVATRKNLGNRANSRGAYLGAVGIYTALTDSNPVGIRSFGTNALGGDGLVNDTTALEMQTIAYKFVLNGNAVESTQIFYKDEEYSAMAKALIATADAYARRGAMIQYDDTRIMKNADATLTAEYRGKHGVQSPELATEQNTLYSNCAAFINSLFWEAFDYDIVSWYTAEFITRTEMRVLYRTPTGSESTYDEACMIDEIKATLRPGDLIVYRYPENAGGHILLYAGNDKYIHSRGGNYNYSTQSENAESYGTVCYESVRNTLYKKGDARYLPDQQSYAILRPLNLITSAIPQKTINRVNGMWGVVAQKLSSHPQGISANAGDNVTYTIKVQNSSSEKVSLKIQNTLNANTSLVSTTGQQNGNILSWNVELISGQVMELTYTVKINSGLAKGTAVGHGQTTVNGINLYCADVIVNKTLTTAQKASIDSLARAKVGSSDSILSVVNSVYSSAVGINKGYTTNKALFGNVFATNSKNSSYLSVKSSASMVVQTLYGGYYVASTSSFGSRTQVIRPHMMMEGDVLILSQDNSGNGCDTYLVLSNGELLGTSSSGLNILTEKERDTLFASLLGKNAFAVVRPSYTN